MTRPRSAAGRRVTEEKSERSSANGLQNEIYFAGIQIGCVRHHHPNSIIRIHDFLNKSVRCSNDCYPVISSETKKRYVLSKNFHDLFGPDSSVDLANVSAIVALITMTSRAGS